MSIPVVSPIMYSSTDTLSLCVHRSGTRALKHSAQGPTVHKGLFTEHMICLTRDR